MNTKLKRFIVLSAIWFAFWIFIGKHLVKPVLWPCFCFGIWNIYVFFWGISAIKRKIVNQFNGVDDINNLAKEYMMDTEVQRIDDKLSRLEKKIKDNAERMETMEFKYEVLDSLSIRQIENYLEIRKKGEDY